LRPAETLDHTYLVHKNPPPKGKEWGRYCTSCEGYEEELTTHCPGTKLDEEQKKRIKKLEMDHINGKFLYYKFKREQEAASE